MNISEAIRVVLKNHPGITRQEIFNYVKYQNLCPNSTEDVNVININKYCDSLIENSIIEKKLDNTVYKYYLIFNNLSPNIQVVPSQPQYSSPVHQYPPQSHPIQYSSPIQSQPPQYSSPIQQYPPQPPQYSSPIQQYPPQPPQPPQYSSPIQQYHISQRSKGNDKKYNGEDVIGNVSTKTIKKFVYTDNWKNCAGRESGSDSYQFGDILRTTFKSLLG